MQEPTTKGEEWRETERRERLPTAEITHSNCMAFGDSLWCGTGASFGHWLHLVQMQYLCLQVARVGPEDSTYLFVIHSIFFPDLPLMNLSLILFTV